MSKSAARKIEKSVDAYRSIGEAADELGLQPHVLRYWEGKFGKFIKPLKRRDGRRMFRPEDMQALRAIQTLVHDKGMTLKGAEKLLAEQGVESVLVGDVRIVTPVEAVVAEPQVSPAREMQETVRQAFKAAPAESLPNATGNRLEAMLADLTDIKARLDAARFKKAA
ncbi:MAG: MerR family transcriptional regulator [Henriciella sp.]|jgi:DNA-binding transcriptional MerR regulator|mmetsp:Transcript_13601/g.19893  ORF Transcript_13601/g.19893 Transcript_13601/m.19893 type:complete len:167 (+) Transcript_13601:432-932(+)|eukprot:CAMPEP_0197245812 /NCGR_PEP_ID=MMETSP1429-20130617/10480_1 /TAXON_ID=49237 /ORGANISM="Chaetoceros  sp., Strain UNC1202" /LENGTH=166 /DNA_ID=CAMNT_0042706369 /DNA_START=335 /DNA_END=835 /DNA_ORIENTATION=-